jgi:hypothetical protein
MALLFLDSFDHYATADILEKWTGTISGAPTISAGNGRRSSASLNLGSNASVSKVLTPSGPTVISGLAYKFTSLTQRSFIGVTNGATPQMALVINIDGTISAYRGLDIPASASGTLLGTSVVALSSGIYYFLEMKFTLDDVAGVVEVRVDGVPILTLTGVDTNNAGSNAWNVFKVGSSSTHVFQIDDLYVLDGSGAAPLNTFLGDCRVDARYPTAEGASSAWTPLSGTDNALMVDETAPDDDTTYNSTSTVGATDTHVVQDAPVPGAVLYAVQLNISHKKSDTGACSLAPVVRHAGVDQVGTGFNPGTSYLYTCIPYGTNPGTGVAWTEAGFNAAEFGYKRTA